ncbi:EF-hand domain-containing protein [Pseudoxanthomonas sp. JBR18]|uniref:EF-hand domain-containing protein n=1 Tax=Pseudoxanthomonas sp. JBR18 TaxID=2969308 RepID=UPI0023054E34|nr:EF-hand domain-containing protein [Pseudoxanthomonas sp. JBR18]WCE02635.1 EF-hand domain-containing protein [Pseudoxanthomonas sp. JBR18]
MELRTKYSGALLIVVSVLGLPMSALAQSNTPSVSELFNAVDKNHDGYIDGEEDKAANRARFVKFDTNGDGQFSRAEMLAANRKFGQSETLAQQVAQLYLTRMDTNHDDAASWEEFEMWSKKNMFDPMDMDHDGKISRKEFIMQASPSVP